MEFIICRSVNFGSIQEFPKETKYWLLAAVSTNKKMQK